MHGLFKGASVALAFGLLVAGCSTDSSMYTWGDYDTSLYKYYKSEDKRAEYRAALVEIIQEATPQKPVPPGVYAELGFVELEAGNREEAMRLFALERRSWPESATFMDRTIASLREASEEAPAAEERSAEIETGS